MVRQICCGGGVLGSCHKVCGPWGENGVGLSGYNILISGFRFNGGGPVEGVQHRRIHFGG